jgi:hypothetical protein
MKHSAEQKLFIYDTSVQHSSCRKCHRKFHRKYPDSTVLCKTIIYSITSKLHSTGSVLDKNLKKRHVLTEEKLHDIGAQLEASLKTWVCVGRLQSSHLYKVSKLWPYKTTVMLSLLHPNCKVRTRYCRQFQESVFKGLFELEHMFYSDEVWYTLSGYITAKITDTGAQKILTLIMKCHCLI